MLAYDIGCYTGDTCEELLVFYDKVICIDANPRNIEKIREKYRDNKSVVVIKGCISNSINLVDFYISNNSQLSSCIREIPEREGISEVIKSMPIDINDIIRIYGCPDFLKCDIEGSDVVLLEQLLMSSYRPRYISCESEGIGDRDVDFANGEHLRVLNWLKRLGYTKFCLLNNMTKQINDASYCFVPYDIKSLDNNNLWISYDEILELINKLRPNIWRWHFWYDIIASY